MQITVGHTHRVLLCFLGFDFCLFLSTPPSASLAWLPPKCHAKCLPPLDASATSRASNHHAPCVLTLTKLIASQSSMTSMALLSLARVGASGAAFLRAACVTGYGMIRREGGGRHGMIRREGAAFLRAACARGRVCVE